jgi:hypothetical protein
MDVEGSGCFLILENRPAISWGRELNNFTKF